MKAGITDVAPRPLDLNVGAISLWPLFLLKERRQSLLLLLWLNAARLLPMKVALYKAHLRRACGLFSFANAVGTFLIIFFSLISLPFLLLTVICVSCHFAGLLFRCQIPWRCPWSCLRGVCSCFWVCGMFVFDSVSFILFFFIHSRLKILWKSV